MSIIDNARTLLALQEAGLVHTKIGGGWSEYNLDENHPLIVFGYFYSNRGIVSFNYLISDQAHLVKDLGLNEHGANLRVTAVHRQGHQYAEVFICEYEREEIKGVVNHFYTPLYFLGQVTAN